MLGFALALVGTILLSLADTGKKKLTHLIDGVAVVWLTVCACLICSGIHVWIQGIPTISWPIVLACLLPCLAATFSSELLFIEAIKISDLSLSIPLCAFGPIFSLVLGFVLLDESPSAVGLLGVGLTTLGAYVLFFEPGSGGNWLTPIRAAISQRGPRYILLTAILFPITAIFQKIGSRHSSPEFFFMLLMVSLFVTLGATVLLSRSSPVKALRVTPLLTLGTSLAWGLGLLALFLSFNLTFVAYALAIKQIGVLLSVVLGFLFFREPFFVKRLTAGGIMVTGVLLVVLQS